MKRSIRSLNDLDELNNASLPPELEVTKSLKKNWSFSHLLDFEASDAGKLDSGKQGRGWDGKRLLSERRSSMGSDVPLLERFQKRLAQEVLDVISKAQRSEDKDRTLLLEDLFYNSSSSIEPQVLEKLNTETLDKDNEMRQMRMVRFLKGKNVKTRFYFELVSSYFCHNKTGQAMVQLLLPMCSDLWSHELFPPIFSLLLHRWILTHDVGERSSVLRLNVFLRGINQLFWFDLQHNARRLRSIFFFLVEKLSNQSISQREQRGYVPSHFQEDLSRLICRFFFLYCNNPVSPSDLKILLLSLPVPFSAEKNQRKLDGQENAQLAGDSTVDCTRNRSKVSKDESKTTGEFYLQLERFVIELVKHLQALKSEEVIVLYLDGCRVLAKDSISPYMSSESNEKLQEQLQQFITFGMPMYPTRRVRQTAREVSAELFPGSEFIKRATEVGTLVLSPWLWPRVAFSWSLGLAVEWFSWVPIVGKHIDSLRR